MRRFQPKIGLLFWLSTLVSFSPLILFSPPAVAVGNGQIPCFGPCSVRACFQLPTGAGGTEGRLVCGEAGLVNLLVLGRSCWWKCEAKAPFCSRNCDRGYSLR